MEYVRLTDRAHNGMIVRMDGRVHAIFDVHVNKWHETAIMMNYLMPYDDSNYDMYDEISEDEARTIIKAQGGDLFADACPIR